MKYKIILQEEARQDLKDAFDYFNEQQKGLGKGFIKAYKDKSEFIANLPTACQKIYKDKRRAIINPFKFNLIYVIEESSKTVFIEAVMHSSRSPKRWKDRK